MGKRYAVVLAAGQGTRMKSKRVKVVHPVCGKPMLQYIIDRLLELRVEETIVVVGHGAEQVRAALQGNVSYALQEKQLGTGHAVLQCEGRLRGKQGTTIVLNGDVPLLTTQTLAALFAAHEASQAAATVLTTRVEEPFGYGRIVRGDAGEVLRIVEEKDATAEEKRIREINTGTFCFDNEKLFAALKRIDNRNAQGEYYLTDVIEILRRQGERVDAYVTPDETETVGINDRVALAKAEAILRKRINEKHMRNGVTLLSPEHTFIEADVVIGADTVIYPGTVIRGRTTIGEGCEIGPNSEIVNARIGDRVSVKHSVVQESTIEAGTSIGPFAHIRPGSEIARHAKIGNFVEVKNARIGEGSKASHLSYIGDAEIGSGVNIGCGAITVNYDGEEKHKTIVEDGAFVGCNTNLIAPVKVGKEAYIAAGSTITHDVPAKALAIARERQTIKENYVGKWKKKS
ncbi:bifunctional UDP-N-acetylglucosamine diphosphorylase/glucosamine-1-phosphate N-acetyltransferase GlmU [Bacillaceae bacterium]